MKHQLFLDEFAGSLVVITGATSGIGHACALEAAKKHGRLVISGRNEQKLEQVKRECEDWTPYEVIAIKADLSVLEGMDVFLEEVASQGHPHLFIHCAGYGLFRDFSDFTYSEMSEMLSVDLLSTMYLSQKIALMMLEKQKGHIIVLASVAGKLPTAKSTVYSAAKAGVIQFMNVLRLELYQTGIKVSAVNPGPVDTNFFAISDPDGQYASKVQRFMVSKEHVAKEIMKIAGRRNGNLDIPFYFTVIDTFYSLFPSIGDFVSAKFMNLK